MRERTRKASIFLVAALVAAAVAVLPAQQAGAQEQGQEHLSQARLAVEQSSLTKEGKLGILTKVDRAVAAGIPPEDAAVIITRGLRQNVPGKDIEGYLETARSVKERGLPARLVLDRIEQGLAKGVPPERIAAVAQMLFDNLAAARPMVNKIETSGVKPAGKGNGDEATETVARALEKSIPPAAIMGAADQVRGRKGSMALFNRAVDTMTMFAGSGMSADQASRMVHTALGKGCSEGDLEAMERYMADGLRKNRPMHDVVSGMESRMERGSMQGGFDRMGGGSMGGGMSSGERGGMGGMGGRGK